MAQVATKDAWVKGNSVNHSLVQTLPIQVTEATECSCSVPRLYRNFCLNVIPNRDTAYSYEDMVTAPNWQVTHTHTHLCHWAEGSACCVMGWLAGTWEDLDS